MAERGYVYFLHAVGTNRIKIGKTGNLVERLRQLARQQPPFPEVLLSAQIYPNMHKAETETKSRYAAYNVFGEWFAFPPEMLVAFGASIDDPGTNESAMDARLAKFRAQLEWEGHEGEDANPHRVLAYKQRHILRILMETEGLPRHRLIDEHDTYNDGPWEAVVLDEMERLGRVQKSMRPDCQEEIYTIVPTFLPRSWQTAIWIEDYLRLVASPKTYNKQLSQATLDRLRSKAIREFGVYGEEL